MSILNDYIASKGRNGDTKLRYVDDKLSHVNSAEAYLIDNYGELGENTTQTIGSGTINPSTGLPEYWSWKNTIGYLRAGLPGAAVGGIGNQTAWRPAQGQWGWFGKSPARIAREQKEADIKLRKQEMMDDPTKTAGLMDLHGKDLDFTEMSKLDKRNIFHDVMKYESDFAWKNTNMDRQLAMMPTYDRADEIKMQQEAHDTMSSYGKEAELSLLDLMQQNLQTQSRRGYAATGQPTIDRNRKNIFASVTDATEDVFTGFQDSRQGLRDDFSQEWVGKLTKMVENL